MPIESLTSIEHREAVGHIFNEAGKMYFNDHHIQANVIINQ